MSEPPVPYQVGNVFHVCFRSTMLKLDGAPPLSYGKAVPGPLPEPVPLHRGKEGAASARTDTASLAGEGDSPPPRPEPRR